MSRRFENLDPNRPEADHRPVADRLERVFRNRLPPQADGGASTVAQLEVAGNEVRMKVRQEHIGNAEVVISRECQILIDVPLRIDHGGGAALLVGNDVGRMRKTVQIKLLEDHLSIMP
jgi:hypothetical protein